MALSDSSRKDLKTVKRRSVNAKTNKHWSDGQKMEAATMLTALGSVAMVAHTLKIPEMTLRTWMKSEWWREITSELRLQDRLILGTKQKELIDKSLAVVMDRLDHGEWIYDQKKGEIVRKPVAMKDAHKVAVDMMERKEVLDRIIENGPSNVEQDDKLAKLAEKFASLVNKNLNQPVEVTDVIFVEGQENGK